MNETGQAVEESSKEVPQRVAQLQQALHAPLEKEAPHKVQEVISGIGAASKGTYCWPTGTLPVRKASASFLTKRWKNLVARDEFLLAVEGRIVRW